MEHLTHPVSKRPYSVNSSPLPLLKSLFGTNSMCGAGTQEFRESHSVFAADQFKDNALFQIYICLTLVMCEVSIWTGYSCRPATHTDFISIYRFFTL